MLPRGWIPGSGHRATRLGPARCGRRWRPVWRFSGCQRSVIPSAEVGGSEGSGHSLRHRACLSSSPRHPRTSSTMASWGLVVFGVEGQERDTSQRRTSGHSLERDMAKMSRRVQEPRRRGRGRPVDDREEPRSSQQNTRYCLSRADVGHLAIAVPRSPDVWDPEHRKAAEAAALGCAPGRHCAWSVRLRASTGVPIATAATPRSGSSTTAPVLSARR